MPTFVVNKVVHFKQRQLLGVTARGLALALAAGLMMLALVAGDASASSSSTPAQPDSAKTTSTPDPTPLPEPTHEPTPEATPEATPEPTPDPTPEPTPEPETAVPAKPTGLQTESSPGSLNVRVTWDDVDGAAEYWVRWRSADDGEELNEGVKPQPSGTDITVADYGEWVVRVQACNDAGCGSPEAQKFTVDPTPEPTPEPTPTTAPTPEPTPEPTAKSESPPHFAAELDDYDFQKDQDIGTQTLPEAAGGAGGFTYTLSPDLPAGLSFDPASRALTGTPSEAGQHTMIYTAADADGTQIAQSFQISVLVAALQVSGDSASEKPGTPTVTRTTFSEPSDPALDVTWAAPTSGVTPTGYEAQYRKKAAEGEGPAAWTSFTGTIDAANRTLTLPDLEAGATYEVQVRALNNQVAGPWSDTGSGRANRPPTATSVSFLGGTLGVGGSFAWHEAQPQGSGVFFSDADSDTLTYSASAEHPALLGVSLSGSAGSAVLTANLLNQGASKVNFTASDPYGGAITRSANITITAKTSRDIAENSGGGTAVGDPVTGTPYNDVALSYTLKGKAKDSGKFVIDSATGQISVAQGATLDYETDNTHRETETFNGQVIAKFYRGEVHYTVDSHAAVINVIIRVTDVATGKPDTPTVTRTEFSEPTNPALKVTWTAPSVVDGTITGYQAQYRKQGETNWSDYTGALDAAATTLTLPDLEAGATYEVRVQAVARADSDIALSVDPTSVAEYDPDSRGVNITVTATRKGTSGAVTVRPSLSGGTATSGTDYTQQITLRDVTIPDGQTSASVTTTISVVDDQQAEGSESIVVAGRVIDPESAAGLTVSNAVITIIDDEQPGPVLTNGLSGAWSDTGTGTANRPPTASSVSFLGGTFPVGTVANYNETGSGAVGVLFADADSDALTYAAAAEHPALLGVSLTGAAGEAKLQVTLLNQGSSDITYTARDAYGGSVTRTATIGITAKESRSIAEYSAAGTALGDPVTGTPYNNVALSYTLQGNAADSGLFVIDAATGQISVAPGATLDYAIDDQYREIEYWQGEVFAKFYRGEVHYTVDGHAAVIEVLLVLTEVAPGKPGTPTLTRTTSSEPMNPALDAAWTAADANGLTITGYQVQYRKQGETDWTPYTGAVSSTAVTLPDLPAGATYETQVRAVARKDRDITLSVSPASFGENESAANITVTATRQGTSGAVTVDLAFSGTATDGTDYTAWTLPDVTIADGQTSASVTLTFTGWDDELTEGSESIVVAGTATGLTVASAAITIIDTEQPGGIIASPSERFGPWSDTGTGTANRPPTATSVSFLGGTFPVGTKANYNETGAGALGVMFADADSDALTYAAAAEHPALLGVSLTGAAGEAKLQVTLLNQGSSDITYTARDAYGGSVTRTATIGITAKETRSIAEYSAAGTAVGAPVTGTPYDDGDPNTNDALTYSLTGNAADSDLFVIDSSTGQISVAPIAPLDYETDDEYREIEYWPPNSGNVHAKFYRGKVHYTVDGHAAVIDVNIVITDVMPGKPGAPALARTEFSEPSDPALDVTWTASAANGLTMTGYEARYRVKVAEGDTPNAWTDYTGALDATATSLNLPDLTAGNTYEAQVRGVARDGGGEDITLSVSPASFNEDHGGLASITVTATRQGTSGAATVSLRTFGGTADDGTDFTAIQWPSVTIPDGQTSKSVVLNFTSWDDTLVEGSESLIISGTAAGLTVGSAIVTIIDDEKPGPVITGWEFSPWSDTGTGRANRPPTASSASFLGGTFPVGTIANYNETGAGAVGVLFADADSDALTYSAAAQHPALLGVSLTGAAGEAKLQVTLLNQGSSKVNYTASDAYGGSVTRSATIGITATTARDIAENSAAGTAVGDPVTGTPYNGVALSYTLKGKAKDSGKFVIDAATGQISVAQGATLDYESDDTHRETETWNGQVIAKFYRGEVHYTVDGHAAVINVLIRVTDVEAGKPAAPTVTRTEFDKPTSPALDASWTAPDANGATITGYEVQYRKEVADGETPEAWTTYTYTDDENNPTSELPASILSINLPNLEAGASYEVQVRAVTALEGEGPWSDTGSGRANRPPTASSISFLGGTAGVGGSFAWHETPPLGSGAYFADADGDTLTYAAAAQHPALLGVSLSGDAGSAVLTANLLNQGASKVNYTASDAYGGTITRSATITITAKTAREIAENSPAGTSVGDPVTGTPYNGVALSYTLKGKAKDSGNFVIDAATGQISVAQDATLDYETDDSHRETETWNGQVIAKFYRGEVHYTVDGHAAVINVIIKVTDLTTGQPDAPTLTRTTFSEPTNPALDVTWTAPTAVTGVTVSGYELQYRKQVADGQEANAWSTYTYTDLENNVTGTLPATTTSLSLPNLDAGATYEAQVRALSNEGTGSWSATGSGRANRPPTATSASFTGGTFPVGTIVDYKETGPGAVGVLFADADGDTLTYAAAAQHPALLGVSLSGSAGSAQLRATLLNQGSSKLTYTANDAYGGAVTRTATIGITAKTSRSVAENAAAGTAVGGPVTGTPYNNQALSYSLTGKAKDSGLFVIDSASGQISVAESAVLDYETDDSHRETETWNGEVIAKFYRGEVKYTVDGHNATINVIIRVTDLTTGQPDAPTVDRTAFNEPSNPALDVSWSAPAAVTGVTISGYEVQYRKQVAEGEQANAWTTYTYTDDEDNVTSALPAAPTSLTLPNLDAGATYEVQVRALSNEGSGSWSDTGSGRANRPPTATSASFTGGTFPVGSIADYKETGQGALGVLFADADGDTLTYAAAAQHPGVLGVSLSGDAGEAHLQVTLQNPGTSNLGYQALDPYGGAVTRTVSLTGTASATRSVAENAAAGTNVGAPVTGTPYNGVALTYALTGEAATSGAFEIESASGQISVKQGASLDYETKSSYTGQVGYTVNGYATAIGVTINLKDLEANQPDAPTVARTTFSEPSNPALDVSWTAPNANGTTITGYEVQYRKKVADGETPETWTTHTYTDANEVETSVLAASARSVSVPDLEAGTTYEFQVRARTSLEGESPWSATGSGRANRPPTATSVAFSGGTYAVGTDVDYNETGQGALGVLFADPDSDALTYAAAAQQPALLGVSLTGAAGEAKLRVTLLNQGSSKVSYTASDAFGGSVTRTATIGITATAIRSVAESAAAGTKVGAPVTGTPYNGVALSYTLSGEADTSGAFEIDSATGQISVKQGASLDYETKASYAGQVEYTVDGNAAAITLTINLTDADAPGQPPDAPTVTRTTFSEPTNPALDVTWTAPTDNGVAITGYKAQYRKKAADGDPPAAWTSFTGTVDVTNRTLTLPDLEAGATYEVQVRASGADDDSPWSATGEGRANRPPTATSVSMNGGTFPVGSTADYNETGAGALGVLFADADSDTLTYAAAAEQPALLGVSLSGAAESAKLRVTLINPGTSKFTYTASDAYGGSVTRTVTLTGTATASRSVAENAAAGTTVGDPVTGTPYNNVALSYSLTGEAATSGAFEIDSASGQISVKQGASLDYETKSSYSGQVDYTVNGYASAITLTINLTDLEAAKPDAPTLARTEFSEPSDPALDVSWTAPDANGTSITGYEVHYRKKVADGETPEAWTTYTYTDANEVETSVLAASTRTVSVPDLDAGATYEFQVRARTSLEGEGPWSDTGEGRANRPPTATTAAFNGGTFPAGTIADYKETGQGAVGVLFADADGDTLTYAAAAQHPALLGVSLSGDAGEAHLQVTLRNQGSSKVTYTATDAYGGSVTRTATIAITATASRSIAENSAAGTKVGAAVTGTPYNNVALSYTLTGEAATSGAFEIDSGSGQISVKQGATLDYETKNTYSGQVGYTVDGNASAITLTINLTDVEAGKPDTPTVTRTTFDEPTNPALDVSWTAPTSGAPPTGYEVQFRKKVADGETPETWTTYTYTDDEDNVTSELPATTTSVTLPDLDAGATYEVQVRVLSDEGTGSWSDTGSGRANRAPTATSVAFSGGTYAVDTDVDYNETGSGALGVLFADADGDALTYGAAAQHPALLGVILTGAAGEAKLRATLRNQGTSKLTYTASDAYGGSVTRTVTLTGTATASRSVSENAAAGTAVGDPVTGTPYNGTALSYSLTGEAATSGAFVIDSATGQISVKQGAGLDYETKSSYSGQVEYTVNGHASAITLTINVTDADAPGQPDAPTVTRTEFSEPSNPALDVTWTAPTDNGVAITGYKAQYRKKAADGETPAAWTSFTGTVDVTNRTLTLPDLEAGATYEVQVRASGADDDGPWSATGEGTANTPPAATSVALTGGTHAVGTEVDYNETGAGAVGVLFADADNDTLTYAASAQQPALLGVSLSGAAESAKLRVTVINPGTSAVSYVASDAYGGSVTRTVSLTGTAAASRSVAENAAAATTVGAPVTGTPFGEETLSYTLTGEAATSGAFEIDSASGQISVKQGASLDYETKSSYSGQVEYTVDGNASAITLTITLTDVEVGQPDAPTVTRTTFDEPTDPALDVSWTAPNANGLTIGGYEVQFRKKVADGQQANTWTTYSYTEPNTETPTSRLSASTTSLTLPDLDAGATYEVQVRAVTSLEGEGPWSATGEGTANRPPTASSAAFTGGTFAVGSTVDYRETGQDALGVLFADADGDSLTYAAAAEHPALLGVSLSGDAGEAHLQVTLRNQGTSKVTYTASDAYGGSVTRTATIAITATETRSIAENSAAGTKVGTPVTGTPYNNVALSYSLTGEAATSGAFEIDAATGQISVKQGASLDFETKNSYSGQVAYTVDGNASAITLTITLTDLEAGQPDAPTLARTEFSEPSDPGLDVSWTTPDANGTTISGYEVQYRKQAADGETQEAWTTYTYTDDEDNVTSELPATTTSVTLPDLDAGATYEAQVRARTSLEGEGPWSTTGEGTANRPPTVTSVALTGGTHAVGTEVDFNETGAGALGVLFADADSDTLTYAASAQQPALLGVSLTGAAGSAKLRVTLINPGTSTVSYVASDAYGGSVTRTVTFIGTAAASRSVAENAPAGTKVGDPVTGTPYNGAALSYSLTGEAATSGAFVIDSATGQISVTQGASLDFETKSSYSGQVAYTVDGNASAITLTINVTDLTTGQPDAPTLTRTAFSEPSDPALDVTWTAPTAVTGVTLSGYEAQYRKQVAEGEQANAWTPYSGALAADATSLNLPDLDAGATYEVQVRALSNEGPGPWSDTGSGRANRPPTTTALALQDREIERSDIFSESLETHYFQDPDNDDLSFRASAEHPGILAANMTGILGTTLTVEGINPSSSTVTYGAHDGYGGFVSRTFAVTVTESVTRSVREDVSAGTLVGDPVTGTPYQGETLSYTLTGEAADSGNFVIDADSGQISVAEGASLDFDSKSSYTGKVAYTVQSLPATIALTIDVTRKPADTPDPPDRNPKLPPEAPDRPAVSPADSAPTTALDVDWSAPDTRGGPAITDYDVEYRQRSGGNWADHPFTGTGTETTLTGLTPETTYEVRVRARNAHGRSGWSSPGEGTTARPNLPPEFSSLTTQRSVPENSPAGTLVGSPVTATDREGDSLTYSLSEASSQFDLDSATGQLSVAEGASLDHEARASYSVVIRASDGLVGADVTVTITVTDVAEPPDQPDAPTVVPGASEETELDVSWTAPANDGRPGITDYDLRYRPEGASEWIAHAVDGVATATTLTDLEPGTTYEVQVAASNDEGTSPWSDSGTGRTEASLILSLVISPGDDGDTLTRSIAENSPAGAPVGAPVTATDTDGDTLTYALSGATAFIIDAASGQIRVAGGAVLDYETTASYTVTVSVTDGKDANGQPDATADATADVTIEVLDQLPPAKPDAPSVAPSAAQPTTELDVTWSAPSNQGRPAITDYDLRYRQVGAASWTEHAFVGVGTTTRLSGLDSDTAYEVQVAASNVEGLGPWSDAGQGRTAIPTVVTLPGPPPDGPTPPPNIPTAPPVSPTPTPVGPTPPPDYPTPTPVSPTPTPDGPTPPPEAPTPPPDGPAGPNGPNGPGDSGNPAPTNPPSGSSDSPSGTPVQLRAIEGLGGFAGQAGYGRYPLEPSPGPSLLAGFEVWTPEKALIFSVVGPGLLGLLGLLSTLLKWKFQTSLWAALFAVLAAIFLFFWRRRKKEDDEAHDQAGQTGPLRPAT